MEDKDFDRLIKEKLTQADTPAYEESKWAAFSRMLPGVSGRNNWAVYSLLALLLLSNLGWWWFTRPVSEQNATSNTEAVKLAASSEIPSNIVSTIVYDTIYRTVEIEKLVYRTKYVEKKPGERNAYWASNLDDNAIQELESSGHHYSEKTSLPNRQTEVGNAPIPNEETDVDETSLGVSPIENKSLLLAGGKMEDEADSIENEAAIVISEEEEKHELIREPPKPYFGDRILAGFRYYKPFAATGPALEFRGNGIGLSLEYIFNHWIRLSGELNYYAQNYQMVNQEFYEENTGGYGSDYTFISSELSERAFQYQTGFQLSPFKLGSWRPFLAAYFGESLSSRVDIMNRLRENSSNKIILVEGASPETSPNNFIQTGLGVEKSIGYDLRFRLGFDYRFALQKENHVRDLLGIKAGVFYRIK